VVSRAVHSTVESESGLVGLRASTARRVCRFALRAAPVLLALLREGVRQPE